MIRGSSLISAGSTVRFIVRFYEFAPAVTTAVTLHPAQDLPISSLAAASRNRGHQETRVMYQPRRLELAFGSAFRPDSTKQTVVRQSRNCWRNTWPKALWPSKLQDSTSLAPSWKRVVATAQACSGLTAHSHAVEVSQVVSLFAPVRPMQDSLHSNTCIGQLHLRVACIWVHIEALECLIRS